MEAGQELIIKQNIENVKDRIYQAAQRSGRVAEEISLIAVTKQKSAALIKILADNGIRKIGESYLQEAVFKIDLLESVDIEWHMIGNIQRGKEKQIANRFQVVHSVSSKRTARNLDKYSARYGKILPVFLELNISGEDTKHGWLARDDDNLELFLQDFEEIFELSNLNVLGLMTMAPYSTDPEKSRPVFKKMREIRSIIAKQFPGSDISELSMGMSGDFEVAIEEGTTTVRIGSAIVGQR